MENIKKIVLLGQFGVGKTSLVRRFITNDFVKDYKTTLGVEIKKKTVSLPSGKNLSMIIWDLEGFSSISKTRSSYLLGTHGFIHVFDITRPSTYHELDVEINYIKNEFPHVFVKTVGNKCDEKDPKSIQDYLKTKNIDIHGFVSAKTGKGVHELFLNLAENLSEV